ncbi:MAG TPA: hypothetical protein VED84_00360 [Acidimicrobiales bacterium]|nr:hypothetical protein [Acidimicrobiales bacterium]
MGRVREGPKRRTLERCQFENSFYRRAFPYNLVRSVLNTYRLLAGHRVEDRRHVGLGRPSRFQVGDWVRVKDAAEIRTTLDDDDQLRGRKFTAHHWPYCGLTYQVERVVRRRPDHSHRMQEVSETVALAGAICDAPDGSPGCGRACSLYFLDEWLEPSSKDRTEPRVFGPTAKVRSFEEIAATLDARGRLDGISFSPEMIEFTGQEFPIVRQIADLDVELPSWKQPRGAFYALDGVRCSGAPRGSGGCDRNCALMWHRSWLEIDEPTAPAAPI